MSFGFVIPGDINLPTGGYKYDRNIISHLGASGSECRVYSLPGDFPFPSSVQKNQALKTVANIANSRAVIVDGLAGGCMPELMKKISEKSKVIALIHHPLCLENGLAETEVTSLEESERIGLTFAAGVITTSEKTATEVAERFCFPRDLVTTVVPGVERGEFAKPRDSGTVNLLCVGSIIERKGYLLLVNTLARLKDLDWKLDCYGLAAPESAYVTEVSNAVMKHGLSRRINFHGVVTQQVLEKAYARASVFALPSYYEGYGMAYAEAIVRGLPIIGTKAGAVPDTVPEDCGILIEPGNIDQLLEALEIMITNGNRRKAFHEAAVRREPSFPTWRQSSDKFLSILEEWS